MFCFPFSQRDARGQLITEIDHEVLDYLKTNTEPFAESGFIREVLRFLQLLCEGHNLELQVNYDTTI